MTPLLRAKIAAVALTAFAALAGSSAIAYFSSTGEGSAAAAVTSFAKSTIASATPAAGGSVTVTWSAVTPPNAETPVTYYVTRDGEPAAGTCPGEAAPATVTTCIDKNLEPGTHTYVVTALWRSWSSQSNPFSAKVTVGVATKLSLTAASATPVAAATDNLTITAQDAAGATVTTYTGSHSLTFSGASASPSGTAANVINSSGSSVNFGSATTITFTAGVATVASSKNGVMKIYRAGGAEIGVSDGTLSDPTPLAVTVSPAAQSKFVLGVEVTSLPVGAPDDTTITAQDTYGNVVTAYSGTHNLVFSGAVASPGGNVPTVSDEEGSTIAFGAVTGINFVEGVSETQGGKNGRIRLYKAAAAAIKVTEGSITSATVTVTALPGSAARINMTASTVIPAAGAAVSLTNTALDSFGNTATGYTGTHELTFEGASPAPLGTVPTVSNSSGTAVPLGTATPITFTSGVATVSSSKNGSMKLYKVEAATITVTDGSISNGAGLTFTVSPGTLSKFVLTPEATTVAAGAEDDLTITAQDAYSNVATGYVGSHSLVFSGAAASPNGTLSTVTNSSGTPVAFGTATALEFVAGVATENEGKNGEMRIYKSATNSIKAVEGSISTNTVAVVVSPLSAIKLALSGSVLTLAAGGSSNLTTTAQDIYGNTATAYTGNHELIFTGGSASPGGTLPTVSNSSGTAVNFGTATAISFTSGVAVVSSTKNGVMKLYNAQSTTVVVSDGTLSNGSGLTFTVTPTTANKFVFTHLAASQGTVSTVCFATCTVTGIGLSGTIKANVAVADTYGNTINNLGTGHTALVTTSPGGTVSNSSLPVPGTGLAESAEQFTFTSQTTGTFTDTIKAAASLGTAYTNATITATK